MKILKIWTFSRNFSNLIFRAFSGFSGFFRALAIFRAFRVSGPEPYSIRVGLFGLRAKARPSTRILTCFIKLCILHFVKEQERKEELEDCQKILFLLVCDSLRWQHRVQKVGKNLSNPRPVNHLPSFYCSRGPTSGHWRCSHHEAEELQSRLREGGQLGHSIYSQIPQTRRYRKLSESPPLSNVKFSPLNKSVALFQFVYVNQAFSPSPDQTVGNLCDCYGSEGKLVLYYSKTQAWG